MKKEKQTQNFYCRGIVKIKTNPKSPEEIEKAIQEMYEKRFDPFVITGGRLGNMTFPIDKDD